MKNLFAITVALFLCLSVSYAQEPVKPQTPPTQPPTTEPVEDQIDGTKTTEVNVPVIVTDGFGNFINGLKKSDFIVKENGITQDIVFFGDQSSPFSVALLLDVSLSARNKLDDIKKTAIDFVKLLQPRDRVMIVAFDERVRFVGEFTGEQKQLEKQIKSLKASYLTSLYDAIDLTLRDRLLKATGRKAIVVLSDGVDTGSKKASRESVLELITRSGVVSYTVRYETRNDGTRQIRPSDLPNLGGGRANLLPPQQPRGTNQKQKPVDRDLIGIEFLQEIAARSGAQYIRSENSAMTANALHLIADEIRNQYTVTYDPKNDKADGTFRQISVELPSGGYRVRARQGYIAPKAPEPKK